MLIILQYMESMVNLSTNNTTFPIYIEIITDQNNSGLSTYIVGPGCIPYDIKCT